VRELMAAGHIPSLAELEGEVVPTRGRHGVMHLGPRDVVHKTHQAGGGWGDPLDRPAEDVQADLEFGAVSPDMARALYGAVLDAAGGVDPAATAAHRDALRAERRGWPARRQLADAGRDTGSPAARNRTTAAVEWSRAERAGAPVGDALERVGPLGDRLEIVRDRAGAYWTRCACGHTLAPAQENWREYAGCKLAAPADLGPRARLSEEIEMRRYACPGCGRLHAVDICRKGTPDLHDVRLVLAP